VYFIIGLATKNFAAQMIVGLDQRGAFYGFGKLLPLGCGPTVTMKFFF